MTLQVQVIHSRSLRSMEPTFAVSRLALSLTILLAVSSVHVNATSALTFAVVENTEAGVVIGALDFNQSEISTFPCPELLRVQGRNLTTAVKIDREEIFNGTTTNQMHCDAIVNNVHRTIVIEILDINDNAPRFNELDQVHVLNITENFNTPNPILRLEPLDPDAGPNGTVTFSIISGNEENFFYIGIPLEYEGPEIDRRDLFFNETVDYETHKLFTVQIFMHDHGSPELNFTQTVNINIQDVNDERPKFTTTQFMLEVSENHPIGPEHPFAQVEAVDNDSIVTTMIFSLSHDNIEPEDVFDYIGLNSTTGQFYLKAPLNYEDTSLPKEFEFEVKVSEIGREQAVDRTYVHIDVTDYNEYKPTVIQIYRAYNVAENKDMSGTTILRLSVRDEVEKDSIDTPIIDIDPPLQVLTSKTGNLFTFKLNATLDREEVENISLNITIFDKGCPPLAASIAITLEVLDENDNQPLFTHTDYNTTIGEDTPHNYVVATVEATDLDQGNNGIVFYNMSEVNPAIARNWFLLDTLTGEISIQTNPNFTLASSVSLAISADDNGTVKAYPANTTTVTTIVNIDISPTITFKPWSYQEHCYPTMDNLTTVYFEFRTRQKDGILLHKQFPEGDQLTVIIQDGNIVLKDRDLFQRVNDIDVSSNDWISVWYHIEKKTLNVSRISDEGTMSMQPVLGIQERIRCDNTMDPNLHQTFYLGGVNAFSGSLNTSDYTDFVGNIRSVYVDSMLINLATPVREENTVRGEIFTTEPKCGGEEMTCSGPHHSGCLDYDIESHCICHGGFDSESCSIEENYGAIQLSSSSKVKVAVDYALFVDLLQRSGLVDPVNPIPRTRTARSTGFHPRPRRSLLNTVNYQLVEFKFRLLSESTGTLLYSTTGSSIHNLEITRQSPELSTQHTIRYTISDTTSSKMMHVRIAKHFDFVLGDIYTVTINMTASSVQVSFNGTQETRDWDTATPFIEYPQTEISIGGGESSQTTSNFTGCIAELSVNGIQFPLSGLVEHNDPSIQIVAESTASFVSTVCDLCQQERPLCSNTTQCVSQTDHYTCECMEGLVRNEEDNQCVEPPPTPSVTSFGVSESPQQDLQIYYFIGAPVVGLVLFVALLIMVMCCICCRRKKRRNEKQTYRVGGDSQLPQLGSGASQRSRANSYCDVPRRPSTCNLDTNGFNLVSRHNNGSSTSTTCNDEDTESTMQHMIRSKSSTSGETGFHTASERDDQRSLPRMEDSGNEKDTDYSPFDSSDDSQSYVEMESGVHRSSQHGRSNRLNLQEFSSPSCVGEPLTMREKTFITPLRPNSHSELGEETDLDTDFSSTVLTHKTTASFNRSGYRSASLKLRGRTDGGMSGQQWYKSSTSSDTERERKRAAKIGQAYYPPTNPYQSVRRTRATSASSAQQAEAADRVGPLPKCTSLTPPHLHGVSRGKRDGHNTVSPSPITTYHQHYHHHQHNTTPSHLHMQKKKREQSSASEYSGAAVLSRGHPQKGHLPFMRQYSESPRVPPHLTTSHYRSPYMRSYSDESTRKGESNFVDLGSVRPNCDPIQYWEGQTRMMPTVDHQVDAYPVLSESITPFEDSVVESRQSGPQHQLFSSQGGGEGTAEAIDAGLLHDGDTESVATETTLKGSQNESRIILFPSADCSEEYRCTPRMMSTLLSQSDSNLLHHNASLPPSQGTFEV